MVQGTNELEPGAELVRYAPSGNALEICQWSEGDMGGDGVVKLWAERVSGRAASR